MGMWGETCSGGTEQVVDSVSILAVELRYQMYFGGLGQSPIIME